MNELSGRCPPAVRGAASFHKGVWQAENCPFGSLARSAGRVLSWSQTGICPRRDAGTRADSRSRPEEPLLNGQGVLQRVLSKEKRVSEPGLWKQQPFVRSEGDTSRTNLDGYAAFSRQAIKEKGMCIHRGDVCRLWRRSRDVDLFVCGPRLHFQAEWNVRSNHQSGVLSLETDTKAETSTV